MDLLGVVALALYVLAVARVTRLITEDVITEPLRLHIERRFGGESMVAYLFSCAWCMSLWVALVTAWAVVDLAGLPTWLWAPLALAASHLTGLLASMGGEDIEIEYEER